MQVTRELQILQEAEAGRHADIRDARNSSRGVIDRKAKPPWAVRLWAWWFRQIHTPRRIVRFLAWVFDYKRFVRARHMIHVVLSRRIDQDAKKKRDLICDGCPHREGAYCGACGCPHWPWSKLSYKNTKKAFRCPDARHDGTYPAWELVQLAAECRSCGSSRYNGNGHGGPARPGQGDSLQPTGGRTNA